MSGPFGSSQWMYASGDYEIDESLRLDRTRDCSLSKTFASAGNRRTFTISLWMKSTETSTGYLFEGGDSDNDGSRAFLRLEDGAFRFAESAGQEFTTAAIRRDPSAWYHVVLAVDTTQGTNTNRIKFYINGEAQTFSTVNYPSENHDYGINKAALHTIGRSHIDDNNPINAYFAEYNFIDGQQLTPASFGETGDYGEWKPKKYGGAYGTNGFYLNFKGGGIIAANGGTITTDGDYKVHTFTSNGTFTPTSVSGDGFVEYLVIAGGGAGAADGSTTAGNGGGGAGGYRTGMLAVTAQDYSITVGAGGVGALSANGVSGANSVFSSITSTGGGGGGWYTSTPGAAGGSGGGGAPPNAAGGAASPAGQGNAGEAGSSNQGGGGGGAGEAGGTDGTGQGGDGLASSITGSSVTRAGGGGGSRASGGARAGGDGGGGAGGNGGAGGDGSANTGGGGGAGVSGGESGSGGSGIVIIRFKFQ